MTATQTRCAARTKRRLTPAARWRLLNSTEGIRTVDAVVRMGELRFLRRFRRRLERECPSSTWVAAAWDYAEPIPAGWVECSCCGHHYPPTYMTSSGACQDCRYNRMSAALWCQLPSSPSGLAIRAAAIAGVRLRF